MSFYTIPMREYLSTGEIRAAVLSKKMTILVGGKREWKGVEGIEVGNEACLSLQSEKCYSQGNFFTVVSSASFKVFSGGSVKTQEYFFLPLIFSDQKRYFIHKMLSKLLAEHKGEGRSGPMCQHFCDLLPSLTAKLDTAHRGRVKECLQTLH